MAQAMPTCPTPTTVILLLGTVAAAAMGVISFSFSVAMVFCKERQGGLVQSKRAGTKRPAGLVMKPGPGWGPVSLMPFPRLVSTRPRGSLRSAHPHILPSLPPSRGRRCAPAPPAAAQRAAGTGTGEHAAGSCRHPAQTSLRSHGLAPVTGPRVPAVLGPTARRRPPPHTPSGRPGMLGPEGRRPAGPSRPGQGRKGKAGRPCSISRPGEGIPPAPLAPYPPARLRAARGEVRCRAGREQTGLGQ